ncbi:MAG: hypothetical protein ACYSRZ_02820 [Planctomycetota bacterium]|jgi:histidinol phosphatase-like PHP family hydrolase
MKNKKTTKQQDIRLSRRDFLGSAVGVAALTVMSKHVLGEPNFTQAKNEFDFPLVDYHVHLTRKFTIEKAVELSKKLGIKFGIVEHPGPGYRITDDKALSHYIKTLNEFPVYKGLQPVYPGWVKPFSKELLSQLDYVLMDALTWPQKDGRWFRIWRPDTKVTDKQVFMDRYVEFSLDILRNEPIDIFAWSTFLPACIADQYDVLWTRERMQKIIDAAIDRNIAIEILDAKGNFAWVKVPNARFIKMAKNTGAKFSFGTDSRGESAKMLDYCIEMVKQCGLTKEDMFVPKT